MSDLKVVQLNPVKSKKCTLTEQEEAWLSAYLQCGNATQACREIGIDNYPAQRGSEFKRKLAPFIQENLRAMIGNCAPSALEVIYDLAINCPDPKVRLTAAQDLLNRAGYKEVTKHEITVADKSDEEIDNEIKRLLRKGGIIDAEVLH